ncbi:MAG: GNAT family N-acetyltransferase [Actinomycetota bacterium]|nr:GNAT family N-acetyltransferase [Actinomycetota bacterium]
MIREARRGDEADILRLVRALADYEREPDAVSAGEADLAVALFGPQPLVHADVCEESGRLVGMAVWYLSFSTWTGRHSLYLEDLFVEHEYRSRGLGRALFRRLAARAVELRCARMDWAVLDWNQPAAGFYRRMGAAPMDEWTTWRLEGDALTGLAG